MTRRAMRGLTIVAVAAVAVAAATLVIGRSAPVDGEQAAIGTITRIGRSG